MKQWLWATPETILLYLGEVQDAGFQAAGWATVTKLRHCTEQEELVGVMDAQLGLAPY